jgi:hypothetical protein
MEVSIAVSIQSFVVLKNNQFHCLLSFVAAFECLFFAAQTKSQKREKLESPKEQLC